MARTSDIVDGIFRVDLARRVSESTYHERIKRAEPRHGDILYSREGTYFGLAAEVPPDTKVCLGQRMVLLRPDPSQVHPTYLRFWLNSNQMQSHIHGHRDGSVAERFNLPTIRRLPICIPDLHQQQSIVTILGALDDKIELNRRMNETLEAMARAIFRSWFVDFDPVRAKAEGRETGLPADVADLFPNSFEASELGEIPAGWGCVPLPQIVDVNPPRSLRRAEPAPYLDMANMPAATHAPTSWSERRFGSGTRFTNGDTLLARITPCLENGKTAWVDFLGEGQVGWGSTEYIVLRPKPPIPTVFGYCLARSAEFREFAIQSMTGSSGRQRVPVDALRQYLLAAPPEPIARRFGEIVELVLARVSSAVSESRTLAAIRDTLLPKLLSGEIRVGEAERLMVRTGV
ncbi:MAG: restriction endonuclease subunit S [Dehalococcoidia bacterium]